MKYDVVQQSLEEYWQSVWFETLSQFQNVSFSADLYEEFVRFQVIFGEGFKRTVNIGCYRQPGMVMVTVYTKPGMGTARKLQLATLVSQLLTDKVISPVDPLIAPKVNLKEPSLFNDDKDMGGFVQAQVSVPFYYDLEMSS